MYSSGIRHETDFETLRERLAAFDDLPLQAMDYEQAARWFHRCPSRGVTGTPIDLLIRAVVIRHGLSLFATDRDFEHYAKYLPIRLHAHGISLAALCASPG